jgi:hypothetical protein
MANRVYSVLSRFFYLLKRITSIPGNRLSLITLWLIFLGVSIYNIQNKDWNRPIRLIKDDVHFYYIYSAAVVVYHDVKFDRVYNKLPGSIRRDLWLPTHKETGKSYSKMSLGLALVYAPFTAFAHYVLVPLTGDAPDGYSPPYKMGLLLSAMLFFLFGLWHLRKILLEHFSESVTALTLIIVAFGTNLSWYITTEATMSHVYSFALIIYLYRLLQKWFRYPTTGLTIASGLVFGLIVLIRPTNLMFIVLFFATNDIRNRVMYLFQHAGKIMLMIAMFLVVWIPQFAFWKYVSGDWFLYTYNNETFFWHNPQIISSIFSFRKGWLVYTPLMALAFIGLPLLWKQSRNLFWQVVSVLALLIFINSSWWCWWFGGSYGNRAYIDGYGIYALSIAALFKAISERKIKLLNITGIVVLAAFTCLNLFQTWQYRMGLIHYVSETRETYWMNFLKTKPHPDYFNNLVKPDHSYAILGIYYPKTEIIELERQKLKSTIVTDQPFFIQYYKSIASDNEGLKKLIQQQNQQTQKDSIIENWAAARYKELQKRH